MVESLSTILTVTLLTLPYLATSRRLRRADICLCRVGSCSCPREAKVTRLIAMAMGVCRAVKIVRAEGPGVPEQYCSGGVRALRELKTSSVGTEVPG